MARRIDAKRKKYERRSGWLQAAEALGCDYSHLRRVLTGERMSKSLSGRYRAWLAGQPSAHTVSGQTPDGTTKPQAPRPSGCRVTAGFSTPIAHE